MRIVTLKPKGTSSKNAQRPDIILMFEIVYVTVKANNLISSTWGPVDAEIEVNCWKSKAGVRVSLSEGSDPQPDSVVRFDQLLQELSGAYQWNCVPNMSSWLVVRLSLIVDQTLSLKKARKQLRLLPEVCLISTCSAYSTSFFFLLSLSASGKIKPEVGLCVTRVVNETVVCDLMACVLPLRWPLKFTEWRLMYRPTQEIRSYALFAQVIVYIRFCHSLSVTFFF